MRSGPLVTVADTQYTVHACPGGRVATAHTGRRFCPCSGAGRRQRRCHRAPGEGPPASSGFGGPGRSLACGRLPPASAPTSTCPPFFTPLPCRPSQGTPPSDVEPSVIAPQDASLGSICRELFFQVTSQAQVLGVRPWVHPSTHCWASHTLAWSPSSLGKNQRTWQCQPALGGALRMGLPRCEVHACGECACRPQEGSPLCRGCREVSSRTLGKLGALPAGLLRTALVGQTAHGRNGTGVPFECLTCAGCVPAPPEASAPRLDGCAP